MNKEEKGDLRLIAVFFLIGIITIAPMGIENVYGINLKSVEMIQGSIPAGNEEFNVTLSIPLTNISRSIAILTFNFTQDSDVSKISRSWNFTDNSTLTIFGGSSIPATNEPLLFAGTIVEFFNSDVQHLTFNMSANEPEGEFEIPLDNTVNLTSSFILFDGMTVDAEEFSWGIEEFSRVRLINSTHWGIQVGDTPNTEPTNYRVSVVDTNGQAFVQTGTGNLTQGQTLDTITPTTAVVSSRSVLLCTQFVQDGDLNERPTSVSLSCSINGSGDIEIQINNGKVNDFVQYHFQLIEFDEEIFVQRDSIAVSGGVFTVDDTLTTPVNVSNTIVTSGSMTPFGAGNSEGNQAQAGSFDRDSFTMFMVNNNTIRMSRGDNSGANLMQWQVIELRSVGASQIISIQDTATTLDNVDLTVNKTVVIVDFATAVDVDTIMNITKLNSDLVSVGDQVLLQQMLQNNQTDTSTVLDNVDLDITKLIADTAIITDQVNATKLGGATFNQLLADTAIVTDQVIATLIGMIFNQTITDTVTVNDPSVLLKISTIGNGSGTPSSSGGGGVPTFQKIIGLSILSEFFFVEPADRVPSDFVISTFGQESSIVKITNIEPDDQFVTWFEFSSLPSILRFETEIDNSRTFSDPARITNTALKDFTLNVPTILCEDLDQFVTLTPCIDKILYEIPLTFTIDKGGVTFIEKHIVTIDATMIPTCDIVCQIVAFLIANYWWLAGILIMFMLLYFLGGAIRKRGVRTIRRIDAKQFNSFSADKPKRKFKRGKR